MRVARVTASASYNFYRKTKSAELFVADFHRYVDRRLATAHEKRDGLALLLLADQAIEVLEALDGLAADADDDVAGPERRTRGVGVLDDEAVVDAERAALRRRNLAHHEAEAVRLHRLVPAGLRRSCVGQELGRGELDVLGLAVAPDLERRAGSGLGRRDEARQLVGIVDRLTVEREHDVAGLEARLVGRAARVDARDQGTARRLELERLRQLARQRLDAHAQ